MYVLLWPLLLLLRMFVVALQVSWLQGQMAVLEQVVLDLQEEQSNAVQAAHGAAQDEQHTQEHLEGKLLNCQELLWQYNLRSS